MLGQDYFGPAPKCEESPEFLAYPEGMQAMASGAYGTPSPPVIGPAVQIRLVENQAHTPIAIAGGEHGGEFALAMASTAPAFEWMDETALLEEAFFALADQ